MGKDWLEKVKTACPEVRWVAHYAILGPYDFMDLYEAPDVESAHKVSLISLAEGALSAESWQVLPYDRFLKVLEEVEPDAGKRSKSKGRKKDKGKKKRK
jgi:uncharacterized protein with GYD domain